MSPAPSKRIDLPAADSPAVSIVVLLTDRVMMARECLGAIAAADDVTVPCEVVLVLNAVGPDVERFVEEEVTGARVVRLEVNGGTAAGWNLGFETAKGPWVALLHEDSAPRPAWLPSLLRTVGEYPRAGAVGSRLLLPDGSVENAGWVFWRDGCVTQLDPRTAPSVMDAPAPYPVDQCSSAALMIDRAAWRQVGGFDERFFPAVYADTDLCTALWALGRPVLSDPRSRVVHRKNAMVRDAGGALSSFEFQRFLVDSHRQRYVAKWGHALGAYALRDGSVAPWDAPADAVEAALELCGQRYAAPPPGSPLPAVERSLTGGDPQGLTRRLLAAQVEVQAAFCDALAERLAAAGEQADDAERRTADAERATADAQWRADDAERALADGEDELVRLRWRAEALDRILNGRTWRTRNALRRLLRWPG